MHCSQHDQLVCVAGNNVQGNGCRGHGEAGDDDGLSAQRSRANPAGTFPTRLAIEYAAAATPVSHAEASSSRAYGATMGKPANRSTNAAKTTNRAAQAARCCTSYRGYKPVLERPQVGGSLGD